MGPALFFLLRFQHENNLVKRKAATDFQLQRVLYLTKEQNRTVGSLSAVPTMSLRVVHVRARSLALTKV